MLGIVMPLTLRVGPCGSNFESFAIVQCSLEVEPLGEAVGMGFGPEEGAIQKF